MNTILKSYLNKNKTAATDFVKQQLKEHDTFSAAIYDKINISIPYHGSIPSNVRDDIFQDIDNIPLTRAARTEIASKTREDIEQVESIISKDYGAANCMLEEAFKKYLFDESLSQEENECIFSKAYERGHSSGYSEIGSEFTDLVDLYKSLLAIREEK